MDAKNIKVQKRRSLNNNAGIKTKISKDINRNHESRKRISELAIIILSEEN